jgi:hypothetical protein
VDKVSHQLNFLSTELGSVSRKSHVMTRDRFSLNSSNHQTTVTFSSPQLIVRFSALCDCPSSITPSKMASDQAADSNEYHFAVQFSPIRPDEPRSARSPRFSHPEQDSFEKT